MDNLPPLPDQNFNKIVPYYRELQSRNLTYEQIKSVESSHLPYDRYLEFEPFLPSYHWTIN